MKISQFVLNLVLSPLSRRGGFILCFHQIAPEKFVRWIRFLSQHFRIVSLDEFVMRRNAEQSLSRHIAITFDDGWVRTCEPVAALCEREKWPITIYIPSCLLESSGRTLWFAELPLLVAEAAGRRLEANGYLLDLTSNSACEATKETLSKKLSASPADEAVRTIDELRAAAGLPHAFSKPSPFIDRLFVEEFAKSDWVRFGCHTVDHQSLSAQSDERVTWQLSESKAKLEEITGRGVVHFCYPYGDPEAIGDAAPELARKYFGSATTMIRGVCDGSSDLWYLPRIPIYDTDYQVRMVMKVILAPWV